MASSLIAFLNQHADKTPDQIAAVINDPLPFWVQGDAVTEDMIRNHARMRIVICHVNYRRDPSYDCEREHLLSASYGERPYGNVWTLDNYHNGVLRPGGRFWFRSYDSFMRNPNEGW